MIDKPASECKSCKNGCSRCGEKNDHPHFHTCTSPGNEGKSQITGIPGKNNHLPDAKKMVPKPDMSEKCKKCGCVHANKKIKRNEIGCFHFDCKPTPPEIPDSEKSKCCNALLESIDNLRVGALFGSKCLRCYTCGKQYKEPSVVGESPNSSETPNSSKSKCECIPGDEVPCHYCVAPAMALLTKRLKNPSSTSDQSRRELEEARELLSDWTTQICNGVKWPTRNWVVSYIGELLAAQDLISRAEQKEECEKEWLENEKKWCDIVKRAKKEQREADATYCQEILDEEKRVGAYNSNFHRKRAAEEIQQKILKQGNNQ